MTDAFAHPWLSGLFDDPEAVRIWSAEQDLRRMLAFEAAWSRATGDPVAARTIEAWRPDIARLRDGTARDGVPVPALVDALRQIAGTDVHRGATSQDVMDSALAMALRDTVDLIRTRVEALERMLGELDARFGARSVMGRTRMQDALPISATTRIGAWAQPLPRHRDRLISLRPRVAVIQIGGPVGDRRDLPANVVPAVAAELELAPGPCWHTARDSVAEAGAVFAGIAASCGKIGQDVAQMALAGDIRLAGGGRSSAMAHKQNPVGAELLVTLARFSGAQAGALGSVVVHEYERSGAAWMLEWMVLPNLAVAACCALRKAEQLIGDIDELGAAG